MDAFIGHNTALFHLRRFASLGIQAPRVSRHIVSSRFEISPDLLLFLAKYPTETGRIDVLVSSAEGRRSNHLAQCHVWSTAIPESSFWEVAPHVYLSSPEFCFLQLANTLSVIELIQLGYELCGCYATSKQDSRGFVKTKHPMTTPQLLSQYVQRVPKCPGKAKATQAVKWIVGNSWSPMETDTAILLTLPTKMGGYQIPLPQLNRRIDLDGELRRRAGKTRYYLDLSWGNSVVLEFNGDNHLNKLAAGKDRTREVILHQMGIRTIVITQYQVLRIEEFDTVVRLLCKLLDRKYRQPTHDQMEHKRLLRQQLFARFGPQALVS